jgi:hypothetical protein
VEIPKLITDYIDNLTDEERDRIIQAHAFNVGGGGLKEKVTKGRRIRAFLDDMLRPIKTETEPGTVLGDTGCLIDHAKAGKSTVGYGTVGRAFDDFYRTHSEEAIRAIKAYAARKNGVLITPSPEVPKVAPRQLRSVKH